MITRACRESSSHRESGRLTHCILPQAGPFQSRFFQWEPSMSSEASATAASSKTLITVRVSCEIHVACGVQLRITLSVPSNMVDFFCLSFSCSPHRIVCCVVLCCVVFVLSRVGKGIVEAHPHYEEWLQLPALMSDGWFFARSAVCLSLPFCPCHQAYYLLLPVLASTYQLDVQLPSSNQH